jgi:hypothetical protein
VRIFIFVHLRDFVLGVRHGKGAEGLSAFRRDAAPLELPAAHSVMPAEVARLLAISGAAVRAFVTRRP